jgi:ankyrin repeat protein
MTLRLLLILLLLAGVRPVSTGAEDGSLKLGREMQRAILQTQDIAEVEALLKRGVDINSPIACGTFGPLDGAVSKGNLEMLKVLLAHGARPHGRELAEAANTDHQTALDMVKALLQAGVDLNAKNDYGTALFCAVWRDNRELVAFLVSQPGIKIDEFGIGDSTALMEAVRKGSLEMVQILLNAGANP